MMNRRISRRRFLQAGAAAGAMLALPTRLFPFSQSVIPIQKFKVDLPLLVAPGVNTRGIPVLSSTMETINGVATQVYEIEAVDFVQDLLGAAVSPSLTTKLWGYAGLGTTPQYLGGVIVAQGGNDPIPTQVRITNALPSHHILPNDTTLLDPFSNEASFGDRVDRIAVHLHGAFDFWAYDGGPFLWFSNPNNPGGFVTGSSFQNGSGVDGTAIYNYPNQQSARFLWYHDHAYGLTRTNVFAGLASAYLITDNDTVHGEKYLINSEIIPGAGLTAETGLLGFPLVIQDKTFWQKGRGDDNYPGAVPGVTIHEGDLWYPHKYESVPAADLPAMSLPPSEPPTFNNARWDIGPATQPLPTISSVPEYFSDTILVNGAPYPTLTVDPKRYRFRFLNASQGRVYNLQLYVADSSTDGITLKPIADPTTAGPDDLDVNGNILLVPQNEPGPAFIQIANEAGFLPTPEVFQTALGVNLNSNRVCKYKNTTSVRTHRRHADAGVDIKVGKDLGQYNGPGDPTVGNVIDYNLLVAPAERPDVIIDFRGFTAGTEFILYNDAPAPFPGGDTRNDYFVLPNPEALGLPAGYNDLTAIGGAPPPQEGQGPDTRILMKFILSDKTPSTERNFGRTVTALQSPTAGLPFVFANTQPPALDLTGATELNKILGEDYDERGRLRQFLTTNDPGVPMTFLDFPTEIATKDEIQVWHIYNTTADTHPMHFHLVNVQVLGRQPWNFVAGTGPDAGSPVLPLSPLPDTTMTPPDANERGWRETVRMNPGQITTVAMQFSLPKGTPPPNSKRLLAMYNIDGAEFVWHCHILEHEEHDMMHPLVVITPPTK